MTPGQRRALWICTFALSFIFFYEASGQLLIPRDYVERPKPGAELEAHFQEQMSFGAIFLALGSAVSVLLAKRSKVLGSSGADDRVRGEPPHTLDWAALAAALAVLVGTAWRSYLSVHGG
ncbi:MAG: hypothetical protein HS116_18010 [Planctomycetes bacterium]|nr:hypothetical protein [Planctomycetota bacterium]